MVLLFLIVAHAGVGFWEALALEMNSDQKMLKGHMVFSLVHCNWKCHMVCGDGLGGKVSSQKKRKRHIISGKGLGGKAEVQFLLRRLTRTKNVGFPSLLLYLIQV